jgi:hypothetical protein
MVNGTEANIWRPPNTVTQARNALTKFLKGNCGVNAKCIPVYTEEVFACACRPGYVDASTDPVRHPGAVCVSADTYGV